MGWQNAKGQMQEIGVWLGDKAANGAQNHLYFFI